MGSGLSHGISGITLALTRRYYYSKDIKYLELIKKLNAYENYLLENQLGNKEDKVIQWCHGATGVGLSRFIQNKFLDNSIEYESYLKEVVEKGLYLKSDCLCHGNFGNLDFLIESYLYTKDKKLNDIILSRAKELIEKEEYIGGVNDKFGSVNFMLGLSGMGYQLLRLYKKIPSILLLEV